jgi:hypothetical protein
MLRVCQQFCIFHVMLTSLNEQNNAVDLLSARNGTIVEQSMVQEQLYLQQCQHAWGNRPHGLLSIAQGDQWLGTPVWLCS